MAVPLPLAAGEWLEALLPLLFLLFWVVSQIRNFFRAVNQGRPQGPVAVRPAPRPVGDDERRREIARQVEELIRRAAGEKEPAARREAGPPRPSKPRRAAAPTSGAVRQPVREARKAPEPARPLGSLGSLGGHGGDVARHVGDAFAHEIGRLEPGAEGRAEAAAGAAAPAGSVTDIATLLRNPATLRQMLLVREVLDRPVDRW